MGRVDPDGVVRLLSLVLWELPALPGAACRGQWPDFDDRLPGETREQQQERLNAAVMVGQRIAFGDSLKVCG